LIAILIILTSISFVLFFFRTNPNAIGDLLAELDCLREFDTQVIEIIGDCLAISFARDFTSRIYPSHNCDTKSLKESISSPFFTLCSEAFSIDNESDVSKPMALLAYIGSVFKATGFLIIYYLRGKWTQLCGSLEEELQNIHC
jgi:hypothetical protein